MVQSHMVGDIVSLPTFLSVSGQTSAWLEQDGKAQLLRDAPEALV